MDVGQSSAGQGDGILLFGGLEVRLDGTSRQHDFPGRQGRLAFAYLATRHPEPVRRDELISVLWPDGGSGQARAALSPLLSKLKRALGDGVLEGRDPLRLALPPGVDIDMRVAAGAVEQAEAALAAGDPAAAGAAADRALAILDRELLAGLEASWLILARQEAADLRMRAQEAAARAALEAGDHAEAECHARACVIAAPFRESAHRLLMDALAGAGRLEEALTAYDELCIRLDEELGATPGRETQALYDRLARAQEGDGPERALPPLPPALERVDALPFVGRDDALAAVEEAWLSALAGGTRVIGLTGEPGVGKTRLAARFAAARRASGAIVLHGICDGQDGSAFTPFSEALGTLLASGAMNVGALGALATELGRLVPSAGGGPPAPGTDTQSPFGPDTGRFRLFTAVEELLALAAREAPVLVVLDDAHGADRSTLALIRHLARGLHGTPVLLVIAWRDADAPPGHALRDLLSDLRREGLARTLTLTGLVETELAALLEATGLRGAGPEEVRALHARTDGNPLLAAELLRALDEAQRAGAFADVEALPAPAGVQALTEQRLAKLPESAARVLAAAAVLGAEVDVRALEQMPDLDRVDVLGALEAALGAGLVTEVAGAPGRFSFRHALVRDALYDTLPAAQRASLHLQAADALAALPGAVGASDIARHLVRAGAAADPARTVDALADAAEAARSRAGHTEAAEQYAAAHRIAADAGLAAGIRCDLLVAEAEARHRLGEGDAARAACLAAADLARASGDPERLARTALAIGGAYFDSGVVDASAITLLEDALTVLGSQRPALQARLEARLAETLFWAGAPDRERVDALSAHAVEMAEATGDPALLVIALAARHEALRHPAGLDQRLELADRFVGLAGELGDRALAAQAHQLRGVDLLESGDRDGAEAAFVTVSRLAAELRQPLFDRYVALWRVMRAHIDGRFDKSERLAGEAMQVALRAGARDAAQAFGVQLWCVLRYQGGVEVLRPTAEAILDEFPGMPVWRAGLALLCAESDDMDAGREHLGILRAGGFGFPLDAFYLVALMLAADAADALGDTAAAAILQPKLEPFAGMVGVARGAACFGPVARPLALMDAALGQTGAAEAHFEQALSVAAGLRSPVFERHVLTDQARIRARGD